MNQKDLRFVDYLYICNVDLRFDAPNPVVCFGVCVFFQNNRRNGQMDGEMVTMYSLLYSIWSEYKTM
jgi:hypothetical protein